jgi:hypothetical protein
MIDTLTYNERTRIADNAAMIEGKSRIAELHALFETSANGVANNTIAAINYGRELGIHLQGIANAAQMTLSFFQTHCYDLPFDYTAAQRFIALSRRAPNKISNMQEAAPLMQAMLFTSELLPTPEHRTTQQISHAQPPFVIVCHALGAAWLKVEEAMRDKDEWDTDTRISIKKEIERFELRASELKAKL